MDHQTAGQFFCQPIVPLYYIEDCRILCEVMMGQQIMNDSYFMLKSKKISLLDFFLQIYFQDCWCIWFSLLKVLRFYGRGIVNKSWNWQFRLRLRASKPKQTWRTFATRYSLIFMRPIYYIDTWAIIWHGIVCWFMVFSLFLPVLACCDHKIVLHIKTRKETQVSKV